jgi:hypothetical protein
MAKEGPSHYDDDPLSFFGLGDDENVSSKPYSKEEDSDKEELPEDPKTPQKPLSASEPISLLPSPSDIAHLASYDSYLLMQYKNKENPNTETKALKTLSPDFKKSKVHPKGI